jgi:hypothetical protein
MATPPYSRRLHLQASAGLLRCWSPALRPANVILSALRGWLAPRNPTISHGRFISIEQRHHNLAPAPADVAIARGSRGPAVFIPILSRGALVSSSTSSCMNHRSARPNSTKKSSAASASGTLPHPESGEADPGTTPNCNSPCPILSHTMGFDGLQLHISANCYTSV